MKVGSVLSLCSAYMKYLRGCHPMTSATKRGRVPPVAAHVVNVAAGNVCTLITNIHLLDVSICLAVCYFAM